MEAYWSPYMTIDVTDSHIYLGTGNVYFIVTITQLIKEMVKEQLAL